MPELFEKFQNRHPAIRILKNSANPQAKGMQMGSSNHYSDQQLKRMCWMGAALAAIGLCFSIHGGMNLLEIYNQPAPMFAMQRAFTPEKGRMWSEFLAGASVCLTGILIGIKAVGELRQKHKSE